MADERAPARKSFERSGDQGEMPDKNGPVDRSESASDDQDQHNNQCEAETAAAIIAGAVKTASADPAKAAKQRDDKNDEKDGS